MASPVVLNQDGTLNSQANPAHGGSIVTFWATGWQSNFPLADGQVQSVADNDACTGLSGERHVPPAASHQHGILLCGAG